MEFVQIGYGIAAGIHRQKFADFGVIPAGIIESNEEKHSSIAVTRHKVCKTYECASKLTLGFGILQPQTSSI